MPLIDVQGVEFNVESEGAKDDSIVIVKGSYHRKKKKCIKGFGLCYIKVLPRPKRDSELAESLIRRLNRPHDGFFAVMALDDVKSSLEIRFLEEVPHFERDFYVDEGYPGAERELRRVCGYEILLPTIGMYRAKIAPGAPFGTVVVDVLRGRKRA